MTSYLTDEGYNHKLTEVLSDCTLCPRECHVNRTAGETGYCKSDSTLNVASVTLHKGEEPAISGPNGLCNIFFAHCNLQCIFCQNHQISSNQTDIVCLSPEHVYQQVFALLKNDIRSVGFVSPSHLLPQMKIMIHTIRLNGFSPMFVFNSNGYDKKESVRELENLIDIFLPDYKYSDRELSYKYSGTNDYPEVALSSIREMYGITGNVLATDTEGNATRGLVIRHLVLPGHTENSINVLRNIAEHISPNIHISLMSQYHPVNRVKNVSPLNRMVYRNEYRIVEKCMAELGMYKGWIQDPDSSSEYLPDFDRKDPFL